MGVATTIYAGYNFVINPTFWNGFGIAEGIGAIIYWPFGLADAYIHASINYHSVIEQQALKTLESVDNVTFNPWHYYNTPANPTGVAP